MSLFTLVFTQGSLFISYNLKSLTGSGPVFIRLGLEKKHLFWLIFLDHVFLFLYSAFKGIQIKRWFIQFKYGFLSVAANLLFSRTLNLGSIMWLKGKRKKPHGLTFLPLLWRIYVQIWASSVGVLECSMNCVRITKHNHLHQLKNRRMQTQREKCSSPSKKKKKGKRKTACRERGGRRGLRETREMSSILRDKSPALPSTACPWSSRCNRPHTGKRVCHPLSLRHAHTHTHTHTHTLECREHITAAAIIKHTITVRSERLVGEREVKRQDWSRAFQFSHTGCCGV